MDASDQNFKFPKHDPANKPLVDKELNSHKMFDKSAIVRDLDEN